MVPVMHPPLDDLKAVKRLVRHHVRHVDDGYASASVADASPKLRKMRDIGCIQSILIRIRINLIPTMEAMPIWPQGGGKIDPQ